MKKIIIQRQLKLSIITINLNNAKGLEETLYSIVNQNFSTYELIVIDGGSKDGSTNVINKYADRIEYWVSKPDKGIYNAMNKGIFQAKGEYCFFLNSGDRFVTDSVLEKVFCNPINADVIYGNLLVCDKNNKIIDKCNGKTQLTFLDVYVSNLKHQSSFIKRVLFDTYGFYDEELIIVADWAFFVKSVGLGDATTKYLDIDISYFKNDGISYSSSEICLKEKKQVLESYLPLRIREDYKNFSTFATFDGVMKYKFTMLLLRVINKSVRFFENLLRLI